jgi:hypothetical protein
LEQSLKKLVSRLLKALNLLLKPLGVEIQRRSYFRWLSNRHKVLASRYNVALCELLACYTAHVFPDLPANDKRETLLARLEGTNPSEALWILEKLHRSLKVVGDVCEFGVAQGRTSALIANELQHTPKTLWLFDSFQGLSRPTEKDKLIDDILNFRTIEAYAGTMSYPVERVKAALAQVAFPQKRVKIVPGFIEETIQSASLPDTVCFAYVDFDFYEPIKIALNFLAKALVVGGYVVVDDYGYFSSGGETAVQEFMEQYGKAFELELPPAWAGHFAVLHKHSEITS